MLAIACHMKDQAEKQLKDQRAPVTHNTPHTRDYTMTARFNMQRSTKSTFVHHHPQDTQAQLLGKLLSDEVLLLLPVPTGLFCSCWEKQLIQKQSKTKFLQLCDLML